MTKPDKRRRKGNSGKKEIRDAAIMADALAGKKTTEIAEKHGVSRQTVSAVLNSEETKAMVKEAQSQIAGMIPKALEVYMNALENNSIDPTLAVNVARDILKSAGALQTKVEVDHKFPRPVVIQRLNGSTVILGTVADAKLGEEE